MFIFSQLPIFGTFFTKIMLSYDGFFKSYFICHIPNEKIDTLHLKIGPHLASQWPERFCLHIYCQFSPFDFDSLSWPQFCLELSEIFSCILELNKILDWNLIWFFFCRNLFHSEPREIGSKTTVYFFTVAHIWRVFYKNNVNLWRIFKLYFICHIT